LDTRKSEETSLGIKRGKKADVGVVGVFRCHENKEGEVKRGSLKGVASRTEGEQEGGSEPRCGEESRWARFFT